MFLPEPQPELSSDAYPEWVNNRIRAELKRRRLERGWTPYQMAIPRKLTAQAIRDFEKEGPQSLRVTTLALMCGRLGVSVEDLIDAALGQ